MSEAGNLRRRVAQSMTDDLVAMTRGMREPAKWMGQQLKTLLLPEQAKEMDRGCVAAIRKVAEKAKELSEAIEEHERELALWREVKDATEAKTGDLKS